MTILNSDSFEFISHGAEQTRRLGMRLGALLTVGSLVCLQGDLGSGKTTFVQGVSVGWGSLDQVSSPTFQLVNEYRRADSTKLFHLDSYRLSSVMEAEELAIDSMLPVCCVLLEWPEMMAELLPAHRLWIKFNYVDESLRELFFIPTGPSYIKQLETFRKQIMGN